ncbi:hypothetical protein DPMN_017658 [Dreissena polymorpha]|uniref:Uncharacterized protein n=1 Tax=Dreissena polymorpha TaxID=45954 RepID=A0A9D4NF34_DREPO|nr:hypothetical protein DPMN_017658 [Dreissena polymorpha]
MVLAPSKTSRSLLRVTRRSGRFTDSVKDCLGVSCKFPDGIGTVRLSGSLLLVHRQSWHRDTLSRSLLQLPCRLKRLSGTVADCLGVSSRWPDSHDNVAECLGVSCRCPDGFRTVTDSLGVSCRCIVGLENFLAQS